METKENTKCPNCKSVKAEFKFNLAEDAVYDCQDCGLRYAITPVDFKEQYKEEYYKSNTTSGYKNYENEWANHKSTFSMRLKEAEKRLGGPGVLLDFGCALGHLASIAKDRGWRVFATDISHYATKVTREKYGVETFVSDLESTPLKPESFDLVTLYDVIEHTDAPVPFLKRLKKSLTRNGLLHISTPDISSFSHSILGKKWYHYKPEEHIIYFSKKTLRSTLLNAGFTVVNVRPIPMGMSLGSVLERLKAYSPGFFGFFQKLCQLLFLDKIVIKIYTGEMQSWSRSPRAKRSVSRAKKLFDVVCCLHCGGELSYVKSEEIQCQNCHQYFDVVNGVPVLTPQEVKVKRKAS